MHPYKECSEIEKRLRKLDIYVTCFAYKATLGIRSSALSRFILTSLTFIPLIMSKHHPGRSDYIEQFQDAEILQILSCADDNPA